MSRSEKVVNLIEHAVFAVRWMLIPLYVGLVLTLGLYILHFGHEVIEMFSQFKTNYSAQNVLMLFALELVDMVMICQLIVMTIQGGYAIFIRPFDEDVTQRPQWIKNGLGTFEQKIKMGSSIIGIMLVHLLHDYIMNEHVDQAVLNQKLMLLGGVIVGTFSFCVFNILTHLPMLRHGHDDHKAKETH